MLRYLYEDQLYEYPKLAKTMYRDRARQFKERLNWGVTVDENGYELDQYDKMNPLYVIWQRADGSHGGSMRFLPTTGDCMVNDFFDHLSDGVKIQSPFIWECTRFCLAPEAPSQITAAVMLGTAEIGVNFRLSDLVGVFDARMVRVYARLGWEPTVTGKEGEGRDALCVGLWACSPEIRDDLCKRAGLSTELSELWFQRAFGGEVKLAASA